MKPSTDLNLDDAMIVLDGLGAIHDPIEHRGKPTTMHKLSLRLDGQRERAKYVFITYTSTRSGEPRLVRGTLSGMIRDRRRIQAAQESRSRG